MDRLLIIEPTDLILKLEVGKKYQTTIRLKNVMHTMPVAFKMQFSAPKRYTVKPAYGMIAPLEDAVVVITVLPQMDLPVSVPYCDDKFIVKSVVVPGSPENCAVHSGWFAPDQKQIYSDHSIRAFLVGGTILRSLVEVGFMEDVRKVLELDESLVNLRDEDGTTAMHIAVASGRPALVQLLLEFRADVEVKNKSGQTALQVAAVRGYGLIVELLLAKGAKVNTRTQSGLTALHLAVMAGRENAVKLLVENGASVNELAGGGMSALHMATTKRQYGCLQMLLQMGADVDQRVGVDGDAALHWAVEQEDIKAVEILIRYGACRELKNKAGKTPADLEREKEHQDVYLLDELGLGDQFWRHSQNGEVVQVQKCLKTGVVLDRGDEHGWTALHRASFKGHTGVVWTLLEAGVDLECRDDAGYTPLHCAVEAGNKGIVKLLLKHQAPVNARTCSGITALDLACIFCYSGIVSLLLEWGAGRGRIGKGTRDHGGTGMKEPDIDM